MNYEFERHITFERNTGNPQAVRALRGLKEVFRGLVHAKLVRELPLGNERAVLDVEPQQDILPRQVTYKVPSVFLKNDLQYRKAKTQAHSLRQQERSGNPEVSGELQSQIEEVERGLQFYEALKDGVSPIPNIEHLAQTPQILILRRISLGFTQKQLAEKLGLNEQQIQLYEASDYKSASWGRILQVMNALQDESVKGEQNG